MIDIRKLKELVRLMVENELTELDLRDKEETVTIKKGPGEPVIQHVPASSPVEAAPTAALQTPAPAEPAPAETSADGAALHAIESPMVGTFYSRPNPDSDAFVAVGAAVSPDTVVCLVEAMKVFNEIKAETSGTIEKMLVKDGDAVEFGQQLYLVRPS